MKLRRGIMGSFNSKKDNEPIIIEQESNTFKIVVIEYIELFDWNKTFLGTPVTHKLAINVTNGDFYLLYYGTNLHKITDRRFVEITKEISNECYARFGNLPEQKMQFLNTTTLPRKIINYKDELYRTIEIPYASKICLIDTSLNGWVININDSKKVLGFNYFIENTIHNLSSLIQNFLHDFDDTVLWQCSPVLKLFGLVGNCGYAELQLMGSGYQKDAYREHSDMIQYQYNNHVLYISGKGATSERDEGGDCGRCCSDPERSVFCDYILSHTKTVVFGEGVTKIGKYFLSDFKCLDEIILSSTITDFDKQSWGNTFILPKVNKIKLHNGQHTPFDNCAAIEYL